MPSSPPTSPPGMQTPPEHRGRATTAPAYAMSNGRQEGATEHNLRQPDPRFGINDDDCECVSEQEPPSPYEDEETVDRQGRDSGNASFVETEPSSTPRFASTACPCREEVVAGFTSLQAEMTSLRAEMSSLRAEMTSLRAEQTCTPAQVTLLKPQLDRLQETVEQGFARNDKAHDAQKARHLSTGAHVREIKDSVVETGPSSTPRYASTACPCREEMVAGFSSLRAEMTSLRAEMTSLRAEMTSQRAEQTCTPAQVTLLKPQLDRLQETVEQGFARNDKAHDAQKARHLSTGAHVREIKDSVDVFDGPTTSSHRKPSKSEG